MNEYEFKNHRVLCPFCEEFTSVFIRENEIASGGLWKRRFYCEPCGREFISTALRSIEEPSNGQNY